MTYSDKIHHREQLKRPARFLRQDPLPFPKKKRDYGESQEIIFGLLLLATLGLLAWVVW